MQGTDLQTLNFRNMCNRTSDGFFDAKAVRVRDEKSNKQLRCFDGITSAADHHQDDDIFVRDFDQLQHPAYKEQKAKSNKQYQVPTPSDFNKMSANMQNITIIKKDQVSLNLRVERSFDSNKNKNHQGYGGHSVRQRAEKSGSKVDKKHGRGLIQ